ncbi:MAG: deoxyribodipyrimidine photolyase, partial [Thiohalorhabdaceae bacterium]
AGAPCPVIELETEAIVPVELASSRPETAARTLRPRIHAHLDRFPEPLTALQPRIGAGALGLRGDFDPARPEATLKQLPVDDSVAPVPDFSGGYTQARSRLDDFLTSGLPDYARAGSDPVRDATSHLSPYLHFGQIAAAEIYRAVAAAPVSEADRDAYLEQLLVRRELAFNHCWFRPDDYDRFSGLPEWAQKTLADHAGDPRDPVYPPDQLEAAATHDPYWNAAMTDMRRRGYMPNYLRMYWGKKILEWSATPQEAFATALYLNDRYFLDGRDPNGYANVAWCFGRHDRGWPERAIFGKVRYMNAAGLRCKFRIDEYVQRVSQGE